MKWSAHSKRNEAMSNTGYLIRWATNTQGTFFNAWAPSGKHVEASYDKAKVKAACDEHFSKAQKVLL